MISFQEPLITATTVALVCWHIKSAVIFPASYRKCIWVTVCHKSGDIVVTASLSFFQSCFWNIAFTLSNCNWQCRLMGAISFWVLRSGQTGFSTCRAMLRAMSGAGMETLDRKATGKSPKLVQPTHTSWVQSNGQTGICTCRAMLRAMSGAGMETLDRKVTGRSPKRVQSLLAVKLFLLMSLPLWRGPTGTYTCKAMLKAISGVGTVTQAYRDISLWNMPHSDRCKSYQCGRLTEWTL